MRSASARTAAAGAAGLAALAGLTACQTTQDAAARIALRNERILSSRHPVEVGRANPRVKVLRTAVVRDGKRTAVVVRLRNTGRRPLNDQPLSVGVTLGSGRRVSLTKRPVDYFQGHAPALAPGATTTWVFTTADKGARGARRASIEVGVARKPPTVAPSVPRLKVQKVEREGSSKLAVTVDNTTGVPQYDLDVYAWASRGGRYVSAGRVSVLHIGTGETEKVDLNLVGDPHGATVHVAVPPTMFQ